MTNTAYTSKPHKWGPALPGQGSEQICTSCGARASTAPEQCPGQHEAAITETVHDYDPLA